MIFQIGALDLIIKTYNTPGHKIKNEIGGN